MKNYIIRTKNGTKIVSHEEVEKNVMEQIEAGVTPRYVLNFPDHDRKEPKEQTPGFLVWSTMSGCAVAFPNASGGYNVVEGWQGDFAYII